MKVQELFLLLIVLGTVGIVVSAFPVSSGTSTDGYLEPHSVKSRIIGFGGNIHYTLEVDDDFFISFYVLNLGDTLEFIRTHEIDNLTPLISLEDVNIKEGIIPIIVPGMTPQAPAVGAATITPMELFISIIADM